MLKRMLVAAALMLSISSVYADAPGKGTFGIGTSLSGRVGDNIATIENGLQALYYITDRFNISGRFALSTINNVGTTFGFSSGVNYFLVKNPRDSYGLFIGGAMGLNIVSPTNLNSTTQFVMLVGGGAEYYFSKHFGVSLAEGLQLSTEPTTVGFVSRIGLNWFF